MVVFDELQVTEDVTFCVLLSLQFPVAVNCCVALEAILGFAGVTPMDESDNWRTQELLAVPPGLGQTLV
jgi:hypothetical protein